MECHVMMCHDINITHYSYIYESTKFRTSVLSVHIVKNDILNIVQNISFKRS